jgi:hypothetical protein
VDEHPGQAVEEIEEDPTPQGALPGAVRSERDEGQEQSKSASLLEMLFREAKVIAQNLKESGTRR